MSSINSYKELKIWQKGIELVEVIYKITVSFAQAEQYGLTSQIRRSSISVPSNIAEGWGRGYNNNFLQFIKIARGSLYELETQLIIAYKIQLIKKEDFEIIQNLILIESKMINSFITTLKTKITK
ncbi:MAG: four helix bundle protein [Bacteroidota bacterium]